MGSKSKTISCLVVVENCESENNKGNVEQSVQQVKEVEEQSQVFVLISGDQGNDGERSPDEETVEEHINQDIEVDSGITTGSTVVVLDKVGTGEESCGVEDVGTISRGELTLGFDFLHCGGFVFSEFVIIK